VGMWWRYEALRNEVGMGRRVVNVVDEGL
jgi:hypothetical protein